MQKKIRLGVDIGGTFTDVVLETPDSLTSKKILTTCAAPEDAIIEGMHNVCSKAGISVSAITRIIHGTTLATNALIERCGAKTALITTEGFRDVIEMRTESRFEQYDLNLTLPEPLLPRNRRYTIRERVGARGDVLRPIDRAEVEALADRLLAAGYESVAVGFLHAYANDAHERLVAEVLSEKMPDTMVSLSSEISPQMREYERFNTTITNAYIKPLMTSYLSRLRDRLAAEGADCPIFLMHSGGGVMSIENATEFPVRLVESGPAGGAIFAADIAARHGIGKSLSFDMGGTTAKICLIRNQVPETARVFEVARTYRFKKGSGMPISIPAINMVEIGAGGGSLAHVDAMNQIRVGPESAGSDPGPACYGRGGQKPAVTDADLVLGKIDPKNFAGGAILLHADKSARALNLVVGEKLDMDIAEAAWGLAEVVDENMANAARVHAVENGEDLSEYTMIAFGGAAPLHAARLCEKLGVSRCLVPAGAGVGSAIGFLLAPFSFEANRSVFMRMSAFDPVEVKRLFVDMEAEAASFVHSCDAAAEIFKDYKVYMRYAGQGWEIPVGLTATQAENPDAETFQRLFEKDYVKLFGRAVAGMEAEIVVWSVSVYTPTRKPCTVSTATTCAAPPVTGLRDLFDPGISRRVDASIIDRSAFRPGLTAPGPAVVTEDETTIIVPSSREIFNHSDGTLDIRIKKEGTP
ncbi:MAG: hydantoinase/oxoprolinase family protein [Rhodobacteraceae bacterium]|nr:hydantoinase/oxoprolinase family protein [Paracoccaceae bacterium]